MKRRTAQLVTEAALVIAADERTAVIILYTPIRPIRQIVTRVLKKLRHKYQYAGRATMLDYGAMRNTNDPRFYVEDATDKQVEKIEKMIRQEQEKEGWDPSRGWEIYHD